MTTSEHQLGDSPPWTRQEFQRRARKGGWALVLGGGGAGGFGWTAGAAEAVEDELGVEVGSAAHIVATSSGGLYGSLLVLGYSPAAIGRSLLQNPHAVVDDPPVFEFAGLRRDLRSLRPWPGSPGLLARGLIQRRDLRPRIAMAGLLPAGRRPLESVDRFMVSAGADRDWPGGDVLRLMALDYATGLPVMLGNPAYGDPAAAPAASATEPRNPDRPYLSRELTLRRAALASSALPALVSPVQEGDLRLIDGAVRSSTSADMLAYPHLWPDDFALGALIVVAPMAAIRGAAGRNPLAWVDREVRHAEHRLLCRELNAVRAKYGPELLIKVLTPTAEDIAVMGPDPLNGTRTGPAYHAGRATAQAQLRAQLPPAASEGRRR